MNTLDKINGIIFSESFPKKDYEVNCDSKTCCCVCFSEKDYIYKILTDDILSLNDIENTYFENEKIPDDLIVKSVCGIHYICISCIRILINNYENHPINETSSHFSCPYPFKECVTSIGFKNIFDHHLIKKICNDQEWSNYLSHSNNFAFPGFSIIKCPIRYYSRNSSLDTLCDTEILLENESIQNSHIGDLIIDCTQNPECLRRFCFNCKQMISYYKNDCYDCKTKYENENPLVLNYYYNKSIALSDVVSNSENVNVSTINYEESSYLYVNNEITETIAIKQIEDVIENINLYFICTICKISLYKTERCNGLSHHNIERCYACGRIGFKSKGLGDHWSTSGVGGCFRFDTDNFVKTYVPTYVCSDFICSGHDKGDCTIQEHQTGINNLEYIRKCSYVFHMLKSLLPEIRFRVYDSLYDRFKDSPEHLKFLPYKQTLVLLSEYLGRSHIKDYSETIFYKSIDCYHPDTLLFAKNDVEDDFVEKHQMYSKRNYNTSLNYINYLSDDENDTVGTVVSEFNTNNVIIPITNPTLRVNIQARNILNELIFELQNEITNITTDINEITNITTDITEITTDINEINTEITTDINEINTEITTDINEINTEITTDITEITTEITTEINTDTMEINTEINTDTMEINLYDSNPSVTFNSYSLINIDSDEDQ
jgi:hypothetical protein